MAMFRAAPALVLVLSLAACAGASGEYPSLERRPMERITATYSPSAPATPQPLPQPSAEITGKLEPLIAKARSADARFREKEGRARSLAGSAAGARIGTESWNIATVAVSELEAARGEAMIALTELDLLYNDTVLRGEDAGAIQAARDTVTALIDQEDKVLGELRDRLGS